MLSPHRSVKLTLVASAITFGSLLSACGSGGGGNSAVREKLLKELNAESGLPTEQKSCLKDALGKMSDKELEEIDKAETAGSESEGAAAIKMAGLTLKCMEP
jgi:hypothetical protein